MTRPVVEAAVTSQSVRSGPMLDLNELRSALNGTMIETRYQPLVRLSDRRPVGMEALARLNHPAHGMLSPDCFVPQIEAAGLAPELTRLVSTIALADLAGPVLAGLGLVMSVNFPLDVLLRRASLDRLAAQCQEAGVRPADVMVELTESRPAEHSVELVRSLEWLRRQGFGIAIDDVGPAVPQLEPLLDLPFTSLKLDKGLVQRAAGSAVTETFIAETVAKAKARGLTVVAEGVETEALWDQMRDVGVDQIQGYLAARPLPLAAVPAWWADWVNPPRA